MDPNATAAIMRDTSRDLDERMDAALDLSDWLYNGGFCQRIPLKRGTGYRTFGGHTAARVAALEEVNGFLREFRSGMEASSRERHPSNAGAAS